MKHEITEIRNFDPARRAALLKLGRFAVYTAPVMSTLLIGDEAFATHQQPPATCTQPTNPQYVINHCTAIGSPAAPAAEGFSNQRPSDQPSADGF